MLPCDVGNVGSVELAFLESLGVLLAPSVHQIVEAMGELCAIRSARAQT